MSHIAVLLQRDRLRAEVERTQAEADRIEAKNEKMRLLRTRLEAMLARQRASMQLRQQQDAAANLQCEQP